MNPDNKALERTYFIGGVPRIGKSLLAYKLAEKIKGHVVSTDSIRNAAKKASGDKESDFFIINRTENIPDAEWLDQHINRPEEVVDIQNRESKAIWPSIVSFCNSFSEDSALHVVEGVALLPSLVAEMKHKPKHVVFVGNTSVTHLEAMLKYAKEFPEQDWMASMGYSEEKFKGMASFIQAMSGYFKREAEKYGFPYYEIDDVDFESSMEKVIVDLLKGQS